MTRTASLLPATTAANEQVGPELTARGRVSRERIVRAALELMLEHGVAATTIEDVLQRAKASKSQLYHYFGGMPRLIESVITAAETSVLTAQRPHIDRIDSSESLRAWADHVVALYEAYGPDPVARWARCPQSSQRLMTDRGHSWKRRSTGGSNRSVEVSK